MLGRLCRALVITMALALAAGAIFVALVALIMTFIAFTPVIFLLLSFAPLDHAWNRLMDEGIISSS